MSGFSVYTISLLIVYLAVLVYLGYRGMQVTKDIRDFAISGMSVGGVVIGLSLWATMSSGSAFMGWAGLGYAFGTPILWAPFMLCGASIGIMLVGVPVWRATKKLGSLSTADLLADRYQSQLLRTVLALIFIGAALGNMTGQFKATGLAFSNIIGAPFWMGVLISGVVVGVYLIVGGKTSALWTDALQGAMMLFAAAMIVVIFFKDVGSFSNLKAGLVKQDPKYWLGFEPRLFTFWGNFIGFFGWMILGATMAYAIPNFMSAKSVHAAKKAVVVGVICFMLGNLPTYFSGLIARAILEPVKRVPDLAFVELVRATLPTVLSGFVLVGILAAIMSTIDCVLLMVSTSVGNEIYRKVIAPWRGKSPDDPEVQKTTMNIMKYTVIIAVLIPMIWTIYKPPKFISIMIFHAGSLAGIAIFAPLVIGLRIRWATRAGALWSTLSAAIVYLMIAVWKWPLAVPQPWVIAVYAGIVSAIVFYVVSKFTAPLPKEFVDNLYSES